MKGIFEMYAERFRWPIRPFNVLVEGTSDQAYFAIASRLYERAHGKRLMGKTLGVFPVGEGDAGGADGIQDQFPTLKNLSDNDLDMHSKRRFRVGALLDGDPRGKGVANSLVGANRSIVMWRDVFVLCRAMPRATQDPKGVAAAIEKSNASWKKLDTVIEDLVCRELHELFARDAKEAYRPRTSSVEQETHYGYSVDAKPMFRRFVEEHADLESVERLVDALRSIRYLLGLDPDGDV